MTPAEIRWRCERIAVLLQTESRLDALVIVSTEAQYQPWLADTRPCAPMGAGGYVGED